MKISVDKPGTPAELVHVGVLGMKWGQRRSPLTKNLMTSKVNTKIKDLKISDRAAALRDLGEKFILTLF